jgi:hypothetical protein
MPDRTHGVMAQLLGNDKNPGVRTIWPVDSFTRRKAGVTAAVITICAAAAVAFVSAAGASAYKTVQVTCQSPGGASPPSCTVSATLIDPSNVSAGAYFSNNTVPGVLFTWNTNCGGATTQGSVVEGASPGGGLTAPDITLGVSDPATCTVQVAISWYLPGETTYPSMTGMVQYDQVAPASPSASPSSSPSPSPSASPLGAASGRVRGPHQMCIMDSGNNPAERAEVVLSACGSSAAERWTFTNHELKIHGDMCINAKGKGLSGSKAILWDCVGDSLNETWKHEPDGQYALADHGYTLCLTDPGESARSGTQLTVTACAAKPSQQWSLP